MKKFKQTAEGPRCCKCGNCDDIYTRYIPDDRDYVYRENSLEKHWKKIPEHLHYYCRNCGYTWNSPCVKKLEAI